jgi:hypothetical protein
VTAVVHVKPIVIPCPTCHHPRTILHHDRTPTGLNTIELTGPIWASYLEGLIDATDALALAAATGLVP